MEEFKIEATIENIDLVTEFVNQRLEAIHCPMKLQMQIDLAVEEIFCNIAKYAYAPNVGMATLQMKIAKDLSVLSLTFIDRGVFYNPLEKMDPNINQSAEERQIGGLGIFLVKKNMDDMQYCYENGENRLTLIKKLQ